MEELSNQNELAGLSELAPAPSTGGWGLQSLPWQHLNVTKWDLLRAYYSVVRCYLILQILQIFHPSRGRVRVPCGGFGRCLSATVWLILAHTQRPNRHAPATNPATANPILAAAAAHGRVSIPGSFGCIIRSSSLHLLLASSHSSVHPYFSAHARPCRADLTTASASAVSRAADLRHLPYPAARPSKLPKHDDASSCRGPGSPPRRCARRRATADVAHAQVP